MKRKDQRDNEIIIILIVLISILTITIISDKYGISYKYTNKMLESDANKIIGTMFSSYEAEEQVDVLLNNKYSDMKESLEVKSEFCIYFKDENGNLIQMKKGTVGIGSSDIAINGVPCRQ